MATLLYDMVQHRQMGEAAQNRRKKRISIKGQFEQSTKLKSKIDLTDGCFIVLMGPIQPKRYKTQNALAKLLEVFNTWD